MRFDGNYEDDLQRLVTPHAESLTLISYYTRELSLVPPKVGFLHDCCRESVRRVGMHDIDMYLLKVTSSYIEGNIRSWFHFMQY